MYAKSVDLLIVAGLVGLSLVSVLLGLSSLESRIIFSLPLVLVLPGYALTAALFPRPDLEFTERLVYTLGLSIAFTLLSGFLLNFTPWGLQAQSWTFLLSGFTLAATGVAFQRRRNLSPGIVTFKPLRLKDAFLFGLALAVALSAIVVARVGAVEQETPNFTQLWLLPGGQSTDNKVVVGFANNEGAEVTYHLQLQVHEKVIQEWPSILLEPGKKWETEVTLPPGGVQTEAVTALLFRSTTSNEIYRKAVLQLDK